MRKYLVLLAVCIYSFASNAQNVGIGVPNPQNKLHVGGGFRLDTLTGVGGAGLVRHDANGVVYGVKFSGNTNDVLRGDGTFGPYNPAINGALGWLLTGNSGTNPVTHFLGTTDNQPLSFRVNNTNHGYLGNSIFFGSNAGLLNTKPGTIGIGNGALHKHTSSLYGAQIAIGDSSLFNFNNPGGGENIAVGPRTLYSTTTGSGNAAFGVSALERNINGIGNNSFGNYTLYNNIDGNYNSAFGHYALLSNTYGVKNTGIGSRALHINSTGYENTAIGFESLYKNDSYFNSGLGTNSLYNNTSGHDNTAIGSYAMRGNTSASFNTSVGAFSLYSNTIGEYNTAVGYKALEQNVTNGANTAIGFGALQGNKSDENTATGFQALRDNSTGYSNVATGAGALLQNQTGHSNVAIGKRTLVDNISGSYNTVIGALAGNDDPNLSRNTIIGAQAHIDNASGSTAIGHEATTNTNNLIVLGSPFIQFVGSYVPYTNFSDSRFKKNVHENVKGLDFILQLRPVTYQMDVQGLYNFWGTSPSGNGKTKPDEKSVAHIAEAIRKRESFINTGFLAQEVEQAAKNSGYDFGGVIRPQHEKDHYRIAYAEFVVPLVKAVQEQQKIIEDQNKKIDQQQQQIDLLIKEMQSLKKDLITQKN